MGMEFIGGVLASSVFWDDTVGVVKAFGERFGR